MQTREWRRREFLRAGLGLCAAASPLRALRASASGPRKLLVVQLTGGNDGLDTLIPYGDDAYHAARPELHVAPQNVLPLGGDAAGYEGLHPELAGLHALYGEGALSIVRGIGYPGPRRSHFKSLEIWHTGRLAGRIATSTGWLGQLRAAEFLGGEPNRVVHVGERAPFALFAAGAPPTSFELPELYRWVGDGSQRRALRDGAASSGDESVEIDAGELLDGLRRIQRDGRASARVIREATASYRPTAPYPDGDFARNLRNAAALFASRIGTRVVSVELDGFDTHSNQLARRRKLLRELDGGLAAFCADLRGAAPEQARDTLVVVVSEFGRRLAENASLGTDHGAASVALVLCPSPAGRLRGGLHGPRPSLQVLDERGDLVHTVDFRSLYAEVVERWLGFDATSVLGGAIEPTSLLI